MTSVLYYHSIGTSPLSISGEVFLKHLAMIRDLGLKGVSLADFFTSDENERSAQVILTFDDCFIDSFENAIPLLLNFSFSATFFAVPGYDKTIRWGSPSKGRWTDQKKEDFNYPFRFMGSAERRQASALGMEIGCHTMNHKNLDTLSLDLQYLEILNSKIFLQEDIQKKIISFCYPRGLYNSDTLSILLDLEFTSACTTKQGYLKENTNLLEIPRFGVGNNLGVLESILKGKGSNLTAAKKLKTKIQNFFTN